MTGFPKSSPAVVVMKSLLPTPSIDRTQVTARHHYDRRNVAGVYVRFREVNRSG
jgi:hypothetical protein